MNMDARSARTNSEMGLVMRSSELARQVTNLFDDVSADGSYRVDFDGSGAMRWTSGEEVWYRDPETTRLQRFSLHMISFFASEDLL